jgi:hypothetical protein
MRQIRQLLRQASASPFYERKLQGIDARKLIDFDAFAAHVPLTRLEDLVEEKQASGDPLSLRWCGKTDPLLIFQLEYDTETPLYLGFDGAMLRGYAEALRRCWSVLGLGKGDSVAIFDFGTSPISYLASSGFTPYLGNGAADALGCLPICNDGVANMSPRAVEILKFVRPRAMFIRRDCLYPFTVEVERQLGVLSDYVETVVVAENEGSLSPHEQVLYARRLGVPVLRLLRIDAALFLAIECPDCRLFHTWEDLYLVESVGGDLDIPPGDENCLVITSWFAKACPAIRYLSQARGNLQTPGCSNAPKDPRISL